MDPIIKQAEESESEDLSMESEYEEVHVEY